MTPSKHSIISNISLKKRHHVISPTVSINDNIKSCTSESDSSLPRWMCYSPSSRSLGSLNEKDVFDMSALNSVTPIPSPVGFPTITWCEDDDIGNSRIEAAPRKNLIDDDDDEDDDDFRTSHRRGRYSFISRSKSRKRSLCSLDNDNDAPLSPVPSMSCSGSCPGLWGHFILPSSDSIDEQADVLLTPLFNNNKPPSSEQRIQFKLRPRSDLASYIPSKRTRSMSNTFP